MKALWALGPVLLLLAGCAAAPTTPVVESPAAAASDTPAPGPADSGNTDGAGNPIGFDYGSAPDGTVFTDEFELTQAIVDYYTNTFGFPEGTYPEVEGFGDVDLVSDGYQLQVFTSLNYMDAVADDTRAREICTAVNTAWASVGKPARWNYTEIQAASADLIVYCGNYPTGP